jgi:hypothetical protein
MPGSSFGSAAESHPEHLPGHHGLVQTGCQDGRGGTRCRREPAAPHACSRVWHDRQGSVLAEGRVVDVRNRRIVVQQEDGSTRTIPWGNLGEDETCFLAAWWQVPTECALGDEQYTPRFWQPVTFTWKASAVCHKPLYFEERQLERYGHTTGPFTEPVLSGAHFFLNVAVLPYKMGMNPPNECQYPLGYYRPGSCAPRLLPPDPDQSSRRPVPGRRRDGTGLPSSLISADSGAIGEHGGGRAERRARRCAVLAGNGLLANQL